MPDLRDLMNEAATGVATPTDSTIEADLVRGRRAKARQTRRRAIVPAGFAAAMAGVLAFSVLGNQTETPSSQAAPPAPTATTAADVPEATQPMIELVAFSGRQPEGFTIDSVPAGWEVQASAQDRLLLAPKGFADQDPNVFEGKIYVSLANREELNADRGETHQLKIGDATGTRFTFASGWEDGELLYGPDASPGLLVPDGKGSLLFQFPNTLNWDDATIAEFAAGVHLTKDAVAGVG